MRISDWSSDVCSSDLSGEHPGDMILARARRHVDRECSRADHDLIASTNSGAGAARIFDHRRNKADRKSVVSGKSVSVRVTLGGRRIIETKHYITTILEIQK